MVTREQERKALEQIEKIISALGADSYVATAFDGCFEDARENIENDFALCMKDRYESERKRSEDLGREIERLRADLINEKKVSEELGKALAKADGQKSVALQAAEDKMERLKAQISELLDRESELVSDRDDAEQAAKAAEAEVIQLKAKLYDYMVKETEGARRHPNLITQDCFERPTRTKEAKKNGN